MSESLISNFISKYENYKLTMQLFAFKLRLENKVAESLFDKSNLYLVWGYFWF